MRLGMLGDGTTENPFSWTQARRKTAPSDQIVLEEVVSDIWV
jgi:hypothetical protein